MPRKTPEERATAAVEALVAKRDKLQSDLDAVNELLAKLGVAIAAPKIMDVSTAAPADAFNKAPPDAVEKKPAMAGEAAVIDPDAPVKDFATLVKEAEENPDEFETTITDKPEPDYAAIMNEDQPAEDEEGLAGGDNMGPGRWSG